MKYVLIWWFFYGLDGSTATSSATFETQPACQSAGNALVKGAATNGRILRWLCLPQG